jgi:hypothetical protein
LGPVQVIQLGQEGEGFPADRRAELLEKALGALDPGLDVRVGSRGDPRHDERFRSFRYSGEIGWVVDLDPGGGWIAQVIRRAT